MAFDMASWSWPQWTYAGLFAFSVLMGAVLDGELKTGKHSFGVSMVSAMIGVGILFAGGFWA